MENYHFAVFQTNTYLTDKKLKCTGFGTMSAAKDTAHEMAKAAHISTRTELYCFNAQCRRWELVAEYETALRGIGTRRPDHEEAVLRGKTMPIASL